MTNKTQNSKFNRNSKLETRNYYLYLDTSEPEAVLAIYQVDGDSRQARIKKIAEQKWLAHRELSKTLSGKYQELLTRSSQQSEHLEQLEQLRHLEQLEHFPSAICVFAGPGSFTGLRIGISFANALAYALQVPIYATKKKGKLNLSKPQKIVVPFYGSDPKITKPKNE